MRITAGQLETIADIARLAGSREIMPRFRTLSAGDVRRKSSATDVVTDADEAAERLIGAELAKAFPGSIVVGEEASERDPSLLATFGDHDLAFIVDPVDGTLNFASRLPLFGTIIAAVAKGEVVAGVIHDPVGGDTALALRGEGAWSVDPSGARRDLRVAAPVARHELVGAVSWHLLPEPERSRIGARIPKVALGLCHHCAAHEYRLVADGHVHFLLHGTLKPWDHAAGWLLHREAGGYAARFDGTPYRPTSLQGGMLCAPDRETWQTVHDALLV